MDGVTKPGSAAGKSMATIGMNYRVLPGKESTFERAFAAVIEALNNSSGHIRSRLFKEVDSTGDYLILSEWHTKAAFDEFVGSDRFRTVTNWGKEQILAGRPEHTVYES